MKMKWLALLVGAALIGGTVCSACKHKGEADAQFDLPDAPQGAIVDASGTQALAAGSFRIDFPKGEEGYTVRIVDWSALSSKEAAASEGAIAFESGTPASVNVRGPLTTLLGGFSVSPFSSAYSKVTQKSYGYLATATVETEAGSSIRIDDAYSLTATGTFALSRRAEVLSADPADLGFETVYSLADPAGSSSASDFDFFIPAIIYKDTSDMVSGAIASNLNLDKIYVKETRTGLPLSMLRSRKSGYSVALAHLQAKIGAAANGFNGSIDEALQYGSVGYKIRSGVSVDFCYPCAEGPTTYDSGAGWSSVFHPMEKGATHAYTLSLLPAAEETYALAMTETFKAAYAAESPAIAQDVVIDDIYDYNIDVFRDTYQEFGTGSIKAAGVPWSIRLADGEAETYTFQMGFVGQQIPVGYHLLRTGYEREDEELIRMGKTIVDFWTSPTVMGDRVPIVWWDPSDNQSAGQSRGYPSFLRCFVDGAEGMLDAYRIARDNGEEITAWRNAVEKIGTFLAENQNEDGSFYRAYNVDGTVCTDNSNRSYQGTSKLNTPVAVRFLCKVYELTGEERFKAAAERAAEYSYNELYLGREKYVGGTPDNPNTVDKEAAVYALYCFNAAYMLTGQEKYLSAAEHAATSFMSWVYCYDFACPSSAQNDAINPFKDGGVSGFSLIATGHSGADNFSAYGYYELYKLYIFTGDEFYRSAALFIQNNSKLSTDYNGQLGWKYRAIGPEASTVSDFSFGTVGTWLPWSGIANIEPIANMRSAFQEADIAKIDSDRTQLQAMIAAYGMGGK